MRTSSASKPSGSNGMECPSFVFVLANGFSNGGVTTWAMNTSRRLREKNKGATIIAHEASNINSQFRPEKADQIVSCQGIGNEGTNLPTEAQLIDFARHYSSVDGDIFFPNWSWGTWGTMAELFTAKRNSSRIIGIAHADEEHYYDLMTYYEPIISKFIAVSREIETQLHRRIPSRRDDIHHLPYPVAQSSDQLVQTSTSDILTVAYVGRIQQWQKRILDLKPFVEDLATRTGSYRIEIAGDGSHLEELQLYFSAHKPANVEIIFHGLISIDQVQSLWCRADVSISFSEFEGLSISMIESMAAGCVPVVTDVSGVRESVTHELNGFVHPVGDTKGMAESVESLRENPTLLAGMKSAARTHVQQNHHPEAYDSRLLAIATSALNQPLRYWPVEKPRYIGAVHSPRGMSNRLPSFNEGSKQRLKSLASSIKRSLFQALRR